MRTLPPCPLVRHTRKREPYPALDRAALRDAGASWAQHHKHELNAPQALEAMAYELAAGLVAPHQVGLAVEWVYLGMQHAREGNQPRTQRAERKTR
jgi:hypothetical protein